MSIWNIKYQSLLLLNGIKYFAKHYNILINEDKFRNKYKKLFNKINIVSINYLSNKKSINLQYLKKLLLRKVVTDLSH